MGLGFVGTFVSLSVRFYVEKAALNAVESVGNIVRHRKGTIVRKEKGVLKLVTMPTISGECLKHAYQSWLASLAHNAGEKVCVWCRRNEFIKHGVEQFLENDLRAMLDKAKGKSGRELESLILEAEKYIVKNCIVEDVGGFLLPVAVPVKRTSKIEFSFAVPTNDAVEKGLVRIDMDFHVRHAPTAVSGRAGEQAGQAIFYVENVTGIFSFVTNIDVSYIGRTTSVAVKDVEGVDRRKRIELALKALEIMVSNGIFGAKRGYYLPSKYEVLSIVAAISRPIPFTVYSGVDPRYIAATVARAEKFLAIDPREEIHVLYYVAEDKDEEVSNSVKNLATRESQNFTVKRFGSVEDLFNELRSKVLELEFG